MIHQLLLHNCEYMGTPLEASLKLWRAQNLETMNKQK
jgi:hypothetical protein